MTGTPQESCNFFSHSFLCASTLLVIKYGSSNKTFRWDASPVRPLKPQNELPATEAEEAGQAVLRGESEKLEDLAAGDAGQLGQHSGDLNSRRSPNWQTRKPAQGLAACCSILFWFCCNKYMCRLAVPKNEEAADYCIHHRPTSTRAPRARAPRPKPPPPPLRLWPQSSPRWRTFSGTQRWPQRPQRPKKG